MGLKSLETAGAFPPSAGQGPSPYGYRLASESFSGALGSRVGKMARGSEGAHLEVLEEVMTSRALERELVGVHPDRVEA